VRPRPRSLLAAAAILAAGAAEAASFPPSFRFRTLRAARVSVHYQVGLEALAREAVGLSEEILGRYLERYPTPLPHVHVVLADNVDDPNGFATPLPYPLVHLRAVAPDGTDELGNHEGWLRLLLSHELLHIVHIEQARGFPRALRKVLGRAPLLFPNGTSPPWLIEGLATFEETEQTAFGRGRNPDSRMVLRMAALEDDFPGEDRATVALDRWPSGRAAYLFGEAFLRDLQQRGGHRTLPALVETQSRKPLPYLDELTFRSVTGQGIHGLWRLWRDEAGAEFAREAAALRARGLSASRPLTTEGVVNVGPRLSPDGEWIAYTRRTLTDDRHLRLMRADGTQDRELTRRTGGTGLSWTPDGRTLVYDEPEVWRFFSTRGGLRALDVGSGRARWIGRGLRAKDPDVSPDGARLVFVRRGAETSELVVAALEGSARRELTRSPRGTHWSGPRWSPDGARVVASRLAPGGNLDLAVVDAATGAVRPLTEDRAKDVEPSWTPDGAHVVFRSDRDGVSNLYAWREADGTVRRLSTVLGGAFTPHVHPSGAWLAYSAYSARGYDVHRLELDLASAPEAEPWVDTLPAPRLPAAEPAALEGGYQPLGTLWPRAWMPYLGFDDDELSVGAVVGGVDPLFRHAWAFGAGWGEDTNKVSAQALYQYDRWWPTFLAFAGDDYDPVGEDVRRTRELVARVSVPVTRSLRLAQAASLSWRRERETVGDDRLDLGGLEVAWALSTSHRQPYGVSPVGTSLRLAYLREDPAFGSEVSLGKLLLDGRHYRSLLGAGDAASVRLAAGTTFGQESFTCSYAVGGFPDGALVDVVRTNHGILRGYPEPGCGDSEFVGRRFVSASLEYRFPLLHPQQGYRWVPVFLRHLHATVFADTGDAFTGGLDQARLKTSLGAAVGTDITLGHVIAQTWSLGVARGLDERGETSVYFRAGLSF
jgi:hypothetical protein